MNRLRRARLQGVSDSISELIGTLQDIRDNEENYKENVPDNLYGSERYEKSEEAIDQISDAIDSLEEATESIEEAMS
ncbi:MULTISPECIES: hypothetical protein [Enterococcus]|uniref:hypothetical protein n=1 Tax=Enterococcus TaxID=1350 RepID=UPI000A32F7EB|nr:MULTISPECIES: hypothetical protein [Enterococcus]MBO0424501.1 hypothetical protein [Enterococcus faecium]OTO34068.1 hypothetical protein A5870_001419 [Enterococcus sp. 2G9_DIV0600]OTO38686.1 hypothetical protein A5871_003272 [Enterococcus sp. 2F9_DIV0599]